jgi:hypothetical protein
MVRVGWVFVWLGAVAMTGCGTTRWTDTKRTATEQMLISDAVDRAVGQIDFSLLSGQAVYLDSQHLDEVTDKHYLISTLRQHMAASGCVLKDKRDDANYVVEARAGAVGTDRQDLLFGVPAMTLPTVAPVAGVPNALPEIALAKRTDQKAVAKLAVFAYERDTGRPVWQSGNERNVSKADDLWMFGAGPFQRGTIYDAPQFAGNKLPLVSGKKKSPDKPSTPPSRVAQELTFSDPRLAPHDAPRVASLPAANKATTPAVASSAAQTAANSAGVLPTAAVAPVPAGAEVPAAVPGGPVPLPSQPAGPILPYWPEH